MAILSQIVPANVLAKLSETHLTLLNSHLEAELLQNASIKQALTSKANEILKTMGH